MRYMYEYMRAAIKDPRIEERHLVYCLIDTITDGVDCHACALGMTAYHMLTLNHPRHDLGNNIPLEEIYHFLIDRFPRLNQIISDEHLDSGHKTFGLSKSEFMEHCGEWDSKPSYLSYIDFVHQEYAKAWEIASWLERIEPTL